jgi:hypothetical protein
MKEEKEEAKDAEIKRGTKQEKEAGRDGNERKNKEKRVENNLK